MDEWEALPDTELLARTRTEPEAFGAFYRRHLDHVVRFVGSRVASADAVAAVVAEVFAAALLGSDRFDPERGLALGWLLGIAANKAADSQRAQGVERRIQQRLKIAEIAWTDADLERIERLRGPNEAEASALLEALPPDQRHAVQRRVISEHEYARIAYEAGSSESVIRQRVSRGLSTLRTWLGEQP